MMKTLQETIGVVAGSGADLLPYRKVGQLAGQNEKAKRISFSFLAIWRKAKLWERSEPLRGGAPSSCLLRHAISWGKSRYVHWQGTGFLCTLYFIVDSGCICYHENMHYLRMKWIAVPDKKRMPLKKKKVGWCIIGWELPAERKGCLFSLAGSSHHRTWFLSFFFLQGWISFYI